jgi:hypothetical protein
MAIELIQMRAESTFFLPANLVMPEKKLFGSNWIWRFESAQGIVIPKSPDPH